MSRVLLAALLLMLSSDAFAQRSRHCGTRDEVLAQLASRYNEHPRAAAVTFMGNLLEVATTSDGLTWSVIVTNSEVTCLVSHGEAWRDIPPKPEEEGS